MPREKKPSRRDRLGTGWKALSGVIATGGTAVGILATFGVLGGGTESATPADAIAGAAKTVRSSSFRLRVTMTEIPRTAGARDSTIVGEGELDYGAGRGHLEYDFSGSEGLEDLSPVDFVFNGPTVFVRDPGQLNFPKPWARLALADFQRLAGSGGEAGSLAAFSELGIDDPTRALNRLEESSSGARKIGTDASAVGVGWTHYRARQDPDGRGPAPPETVDVWVDDAGRLRRLEKTSQGTASTVRTRTELDDYGLAVDVRPPPLSQVFDVEVARPSAPAP